MTAAPVTPQLERLLDAAVRLFESTSAEAILLLVEQPPEVAIRGRRSALQWLCYHNITPKEGVEQTLPADNEQDYARGRKYVRTLTESYERCDLLETYDLFSRDQGREVVVLKGEHVLYFDRDHLTDDGVHLALDRFADAIDRLVPER